MHTLLSSRPALLTLLGASAVALAASTAFAAQPAAAPAAAPAANPLADALKQADVAYKKRRTADSATALATAARLAPNDFEVLWRQARHHFTIAEKSRSDGVKKREGKVGWGFADRAIKAKPNHPAGHFWASACVGEYSTGAGLIAAIRQGIAGKFERYARATIKRGAKYEQGGGYRALGRYYYELPWPKRDLDKSIALLTKAVRAGPVKARNYAWLAESLIKEGEKAKAKKVLQDCLAKARPGAEDYPDGVKFKRICRKLLAGL